MEVPNSFMALNVVYHHNHGITEADVVMANNWIKLIEDSRTDTPQPGDRIICVGPKREYAFGHMEKSMHTEYNTICVQPQTPFVCIVDGKLSFDTSGGYWLGGNTIDKYEPCESYLKTFQDWGSVGPCAGGAVRFQAMVNTWKIYSERIY